MKLLFSFLLILALAGFAASQEQARSISEKPCLDKIGEYVRWRSSLHLFRKVKNLVKRMFGAPKRIVDFFPPACIRDIVLSQTEVLEACPLPKTTTTFCPEKKQTIEVSITAFNLDNDVLAYNYKVSGGEIVGRGQSVVWDLSKAKPGVYTITASVDNGFGPLSTITKEVKVAACPECK